MLTGQNTDSRCSLQLFLYNADVTVVSDLLRKFDEGGGWPCPPSYGI